MPSFVTIILLYICLFATKNYLCSIDGTRQNSTGFQGRSSGPATHHTIPEYLQNACITTHNRRTNKYRNSILQINIIGIMISPFLVLHMQLDKVQIHLITNEGRCSTVSKFKMAMRNGMDKLLLKL